MSNRSARRHGWRSRRALLAALGVAFGSLLIVSACAKPTIRSVRDPVLELARYQTWNWFPRSELPVAALGEDRVGLHQSAVARIERELEARGLRQTKDAPDLLVTYQLIVQRERHHKHVQSARKSMWSGRVNAINIHVDPQALVIEEYDHADLVIALADGASGQVVWAGRLTHRVHGDFEAHMQTAVARVLDRMGRGTLLDRNDSEPSSDERLLAMVEAGFDDRAPYLPEEQLSWDSGFNARGPRSEIEVSPQFGPR